MKELSIEEKAKRYDEAVEIAKKINNEQQAQPFNVMTRVFPELKESKDERIRKWLIEMIDELRKANPTNIVCNGNCSDAIAWLEKQGEQKPNYCHHEVDLSGCSEEYRKAYYDGWNNCNQQHAQLEAEQNPAWSEDDEKQARQIERIVHDDGCTQNLQKQIIDWFKSIKDRVGCEVNCTTTKEWSEEDKEITRSLLDIIFECYIYGKCALKLNEYSKLRDWLKSLRPQNRWKPSDEQMRVLDLAISCGINRGTTEETTLVSLFNDLKKFRENSYE